MTASPRRNSNTWQNEAPWSANSLNAGDCVGIQDNGAHEPEQASAKSFKKKRKHK